MSEDVNTSPAEEAAENAEPAEAAEEAAAEEAAAEEAVSGEAAAVSEEASPEETPEENGAPEEAAAPEAAAAAESLEDQPARRKMPKQVLIFSAVGLVLLAAIITVVLLILNSPVKVEEAYEFEAEFDGLLLEPGEQAQITAGLTAIDEKLEKRAEKDFAEKSWEYISEDEDVVTVDGTGLVTGIAPGDTTVTVRFSEFSESFAVRVYIPVTDVQLDTAEVNLNVGEKQQLKLRIEPLDTTETPETPVYTSSDEKIATVDENGLVTAVGPGEAVITMKSGEFVREASAHITARMTGIEVSGIQDKVALGDNLKLKVKPVPENTTDSYKVTYSSTDENVAAVDANGNVTTVGPGSAQIIVSAGKFSKTYDLFVRVALERVVLGFETLEIRNGESVQLPYAIEPPDTNDEIEISWSSDNEEILQVSQDGLVTAVGPGTANVTVTANDFSDSCSITVYVPVTGVAISADTLVLNKGGQGQLGASLLPENTTEERYINWASDNPAVASVDGNGVVTAVGPGSCVVAAYHDAVAAYCTVTVLSPMTGIAFTQGSVNLIATFTAQMGVIFEPEDTTDLKEVIFESDNPAVAVIDGNGVITGVSEGVCHVSAWCNGFVTGAEVTVARFINVDSVTINRRSLSFGEIGETAQLTASVVPTNATNAYVNWSSDNPEIASVDGNGLVTARSGGSCTITAAAGGATAACTVSVAAPAARGRVVVLDPGHSAVLTGANYNGYMEHIITLKTAYACKEYLENNYSGVTVYMTRYDDSPLVGSDLKADLERRAQIAQDYNADILVSLHFNASVNHNASGCMSFVSYQPNVAAASNALAGSILSQISAMGIANLGCSANSSDQYFDEYGNPMDYYAINRHCANRGIPGVIIEHCFMDTQPQFLDDGHLSAFGAADARGIAAYLGLSPR